MVTHKCVTFDKNSINKNIDIADAIQEEIWEYPKRKLISHAFYTLSEDKNKIRISFIWTD